MKKTISLLLAAVMIAAAFAAVPVSAEAAFSDVEDGRWSAASIEYAVKNGYMNGVGGGRFDPEGSLTRAMVATVLWRREGSPAPTAPSGFSDVPDGEWYTDAIAWAKETGVVKGLTETTFGPDEFITREQLATMLFRFSSTAPVSVPERADLDPFADDEIVSDWAEEPVEWAVEAGLLKGTDGNRLAPDGFATREQFAAVIERYDGSFKLKYNDPVIRSHFTEPEYPLVTNADFYVSTAGSDGGDGSFDRPFATWNRAVEAVRTLDKTGRAGITVAFMAGQYGPLDLTLSAEDSGTPECPVTYCKYGDGDVVFNNGYDFSADVFEPLDESEKAWFSAKAVDRIKKVDISSAIPAGKYDLSYYVFSDTALCTVARYPNKYADGSDKFVEYAAYCADDNHICLVNAVLKKRVESYHTLEGLKIYGFLTTGWYQDTLSVGGYDAGTGYLLITDPQKARMGYLRRDPEFPSLEYNKTVLMNVSEELDSEGEYFIDPATSVMYVYGPEGNYHMTVRENMIRMDRANDITFRGLTFLNSRGRVIDGEYCHSIEIDLCEFRCMGGRYGIVFEHHDADRDFDLRLTRNEFDLAMDCCLEILGRADSENVAYATHMNALIDNNSFTNYNLFLNEESAMYISHCDEVTISHNDFLYGGRGAVYYGGSQNVVMEYNFCRYQMLNASDGGVFCTCRDFEHRGNVVRYNLIEDVSSMGAGGFALYLDDFTAGTQIYSNLLFNGSIVVLHNGRDNIMRDNILVNTDGKVSGFGVTLQGMWESDPPGQLDRTDEEYLKKWIDLYAKYEANPAYKAYAEEHWPEILGLSTDAEKWDDPNFCLARNEKITNNGYINVNGEIGVPTQEFVVKYSTIEGNVGYTLGENPFFVNPSRGDYRIREGVDFPDIRFDKIGRY